MPIAKPIATPVKPVKRFTKTSEYLRSLRVFSLLAVEAIKKELVVMGKYILHKLP
jgi:hypothetical protein